MRQGLDAFYILEKNINGKIFISVQDHIFISSKASFRYLLTSLGAVITVLSGVIVLLAIFVAGFAGLLSVIIFNPAGLVIAGGSIILAIVPIIWIILAIAIYNSGHKTRSRGKEVNGAIIILLSIIIFFLGGGFIIGPVISGLGGILLIL